METTTVKLWKNYNMATSLLLDAMGGVSNIVGEFAEQLVADYYGGEQLTASSKSADILLKDGRTIQVKARMPRQTLTTSLGVIRSWDFDLLVAVLFSTDGMVIRAIEMDSETAKAIATPNSHQNGWIITTTGEFLNHNSARNITDELNAVLNGLPVISTKKVHDSKPIVQTINASSPIRDQVTTSQIRSSSFRNPGKAMPDTEFKQWMKAEGFPESTINNRTANCRKVARYEGNLDNHYDNDRCRSLLERMEYLPYHQPQKHRIPIDGDVKNGMSTLRSAVRLYVSFRNGENNVRGDRRV